LARLSKRIQKALANAGLGSRREIERWVVDGRITIDGRVAQLGDQVHGRERVCVDGRPVKLERASAREAHQHLAYYKTGEANASRAGEGVEPVLEIPRPRHGRWIDVATLDPGTSGLLLLTTDGGLAHRLMRPETMVEREYAVRLLGEPSEEQLRNVLAGVELDEGRTRIESIDRAGGSDKNSWYHVVLRQGRHRELRAALSAVGLTVSRVIRIRVGPIELGKLRRGMSRSLGSDEVEALYALAGLELPRVEAQRGPRRATAAGRRHNPAPRRAPGSEPRHAPVEPAKNRRRGHAHGRRGRT
jgi:23S rRNA pseudouridine2605 synthase